MAACIHNSIPSRTIIPGRQQQKHVEAHMYQAYDKILYKIEREMIQEHDVSSHSFSQTPISCKRFASTPIFCMHLDQPAITMIQQATVLRP